MTSAVFRPFSILSSLLRLCSGCCFIGNARNRGSIRAIDQRTLYTCIPSLFPPFLFNFLWESFTFPFKSSGVDKFFSSTRRGYENLESLFLSTFLLSSLFNNLNIQIRSLLSLIIPSPHRPVGAAVHWVRIIQYAAPSFPSRFIGIPSRG